MLFSKFFKKKQDNENQEDNDEIVSLGDMSLHLDEARRKYLSDNAVQVSAPSPKGFAMDSAGGCSGQQYSATFDYVNRHTLSYYVASSSFIGYHAMAVIGQNPLVLKGCSQKVKDAMKKGYTLNQNDGEGLELKKIKEIEMLDGEYNLKENMIEGITKNNIFGIRHILFKNTDPNFNYELPFNPDAFKNKKYAGIAQVDPYWITPVLDDRDITDPTEIGYYEPTFWLIGGKKYHKSHFAILKGDYVVDYLKPTYRYGGVSLSQKVYERVYAAERTANEIPQLVMTKRLNVKKVDLAKSVANKTQFLKNLQAMGEYRDNYGVMVVGKEEEVNQLETSLTDLDTSMWANYHLTSSIFDVPVSKLFGTGFGGLGTGDTDDDYYISSQESMQHGDLNTIAYAHYQRLMPSSFNEESTLDIDWLPLKVISEQEKADVNLKKAQVDQIYFDIGAVSDVDIRERLIGDKESGYSDIEMLEVETEEDDDEELPIIEKQ